MNKPTKKLKLLSFITLAILVGVLIYFVVIPEYRAWRYKQQVHEAASLLRPGYTELEKSTERAIITDPSTDSAGLIAEVDSLRTLLRENRIQLMQFTAVANDYRPLPYTGFTPEATVARTLQERAIVFARQSEETFTEYDGLIDFIKRHDSFIKNVEQYVNEFNAESDINVYEGQHERMHAIANQIRADAQALMNTPAPHEAQALKAASVQSFSDLADGFDTVSEGLRIPADDVIYAGARQIELFDQTVHGPLREIYSRDILSSRTIKSVQEMREKLDLILP